MKIQFELTPTNYFTRWPCLACGGCTDKDAILIEGVIDGETVWVCPECCKTPDLVDEKLEGRAGCLERAASAIRGLKGRLVLPTFEQWQQAEKRFNDEWAASCGEGGTNE